MAQRFLRLEDSQPRSDYWREKSKDWESSGLTQADFCAERGLSLPALRWWRWKLKQEEGASTTSLAPEQGRGLRLVPVRVVDPPAALPCSASAQPASAFEVLLESGTRIRVPEDFDAEALSRLLRTVGTVGC